MTFGRSISEAIAEMMKITATRRNTMIALGVIGAAIVGVVGYQLYKQRQIGS